MSTAVLSVSQLNLYVRSLLEGDAHLASLYVSGEISNFSRPGRSGHLYFSLKDERSVVRCVMFLDKARRLRFLPQDGMKVLIRGRISLYEAGGQYQLYAEDMQPAGVGALSVAFEQLKEKLAAEGLFRESRKKPIPAYPMQICVITSPTGAAVRDILSVLGRRWPVARIHLLSVLVQGKEAPAQIAAALHRANRENLGDVILLGRGGGSLEDLWAFNEEETARAVADSRIPVVSAVGHETDFTICDFVADLRAPTPSAAAELISPRQEEVYTRLLLMEQRREAAMGHCLQTARSVLQGFTPQLLTRSVQQKAQQLDDAARRLTAGWEKKRDACAAGFARQAARLDALSPLRVLARGFTWAEKEKKSVMRAADLQPGDSIQLHFADGRADCTVRSVEEEDHHESENDV
ncbi:MAG: exodeoxyribonuclease VII large subunit [Clostridia bacterium]|nr:exodeoxyribonuclease VII large subunit [Clostridia bacterium]